ncbi:MAG TPA: c-type cytochrome biogenesis protein CcsB [Pseudonocardiaceae bacterium]|jgi:cytochrome c-type biogenesis protein CcsB|nr:c-type cytochrome biogenesis protein CcsB [Pseudonocardiaceae bacterium]
MLVDPVLAAYGDLAHGTALVLYLFAMALHAVEYAASRVPAATPQRVAVPAGNGALATLAPHGDAAAGRAAATDGGRRRRGKAERIGRCAVALTVLAALVHGGSLALRGTAAGRVPWGNMYEFTSALCLVAVLAWLIVLYRQRSAARMLRRLGMFVLLPVVILMFLAGTVLYAEAAPLVPALNSYWIAIHVSAAATASGILLVSGVASVLYLIRERAGAPSRIAASLPGSATLDRVAYRTAVVAFPIWTFGVITGAIWAEAAWGRYWGWDPKETVALVAWVIYAGYLHARATAGWRGSRAAWINVVGFAAMLFNFFFVNIVIAGLHSYAGI